MSKIKLKEIADAIREKDGTTEPIIANDFATRIRAISGSEDLDAELNTQDKLLDRLEENINAFPDVSEWQPNPTWWDIETILENDTRDYANKMIVLLYSNDVEEVLNYGADAYATSDGEFYELETAGSVTHNWDLTKDKPCLVDGVEQYKTRYVILYFKSDNTYKKFNSKRNAIYIIIKNTSRMNYVQTTGYFTGNYNLVAFKELEPMGFIKNYNRMFEHCYSLKAIQQIDTSGFSDFSSMFSGCSSLEKLPELNTSWGMKFHSMFNGCTSLKKVFQINTANCEDLNTMFKDCRALETIPQLDTSKSTGFSSMFTNCYALQRIPQLDTSKGKNFANMFYYCYALQTIPQLDTSNGTNFQSMFNSCDSLHTIPLLDLRNASSLSSIFSYCSSLKNLTLKNIKVSLTIGSGTSYGHLLTLDSLLNTIKELHDNSAGTSTLTLTVGSANLEKLADVYVKLIDITDEMRVEDEFIDNKKPFVVCESADEGAMLVTEYVTSKNWQLK